jgi:hypothetical protein
MLILMPETFVPLASATAKVRETAFTSLNTKASQSSAAPAPATASEACPKPMVTLQKNGDIVSGIRVQCGCGQVVELSCIY